MRKDARCFRSLFVGRLIDWKAVEIVLEALQRLQGQISASLEIIGDGPMRQTWEIMTNQLGFEIRRYILRIHGATGLCQALARR
jgi:glycosyltransferase involved in cell wall biosynthesis